MKRKLSFTLTTAVGALVLSLLLAACGGGGGSANRTDTGNAGNDVAALLETAEAAHDNAAQADRETPSEPETSAVSPDTVSPTVHAGGELPESVPSAEGIDIDLTQMSATMIYSEVYNMLYNPRDYIGKTIRMTGTYNPYFDDSTGLIYDLCLIADATACCQQGLEFELAGGQNAAELLSADEEITIVGTFDTYIEGGYRYCTLRDAELTE
ncbi:MAG: hypothetical protein K6F13_04315 [Lachnospiraceae bacterium]|nr:hypothetical protein [Lachnospiraceae bacterium]